MKTVIDELYTYLIAERVGQSSNDAPSLRVPVLYTLPRGGAILPRREQGRWLENAVITLIEERTGNTKGGDSAWINETTIAAVVRATTESAGKEAHTAIRELLSPISALGGRKSWQMNTLRVVESRQSVSEQIIPTSNNGETYDSGASYVFYCSRKEMSE